MEFFFRFYIYLFREVFFSLTVRGGIEVNLTLIVRGMVFSAGVAFFGVVDGDAFPFPEEVPDEDEAADEAVSDFRGGTFSADSVASSDEELLPVPKNPLSFPSNKTMSAS